MSKMEELADELALRAIDLEEQSGDEALIKRIAEGIANFSPTMEETFLTAVRIRRAHRHADRMIVELGGKPQPRAAAQPAPSPGETDTAALDEIIGDTTLPVIVPQPPTES